MSNVSHLHVQCLTPACSTSHTCYHLQDIDYTLFDLNSTAERPEELARPYLHEFLAGKGGQKISRGNLTLWPIRATSFKGVFKGAYTEPLSFPSALCISSGSADFEWDSLLAV
jgi:hypothetical protein